MVLSNKSFGDLDVVGGSELVLGTDEILPYDRRTDIVIGSSGPLRNIVWIDGTIQPGEIFSVQGTNTVVHTANNCDEALDIMARLGGAVDRIVSDTYVVQGTWGDKLHEVSGLEFLSTFDFGGRVDRVLYAVDFKDGGRRIAQLAFERGVRFVHFTTREEVSGLARGVLGRGAQSILTSFNAEGEKV